jgi:hypothetical protein
VPGPHHKVGAHCATIATPDAGTLVGMAEYTDSEHATIRDSAFGAIALVSKADPGFFATFKESMAGSRALTTAPPAVQELLRSGGFPKPPAGDAASVERQVLDGLRAAMSILDAKDASAASGYREVVLAAADAVANASDGVAPAEASIIANIRRALDGGAGETPGTLDTAHTPASTPTHDTAPTTGHDPVQDSIV